MKFFHVVIMTCAFAIVPSVSFATSVSETENCISNNSDSDDCFPFKMEVDFSNNENNFLFRIGAAGTFFVDCGEGATALNGQVVTNNVGTKTDLFENDQQKKGRFWEVNQTVPANQMYGNGILYVCTYQNGVASGKARIRLAGVVDAYHKLINNNDYVTNTTPVFAVGSNDNDSATKLRLTSISGSLGQIFPALSSANTDKPNFYRAFYGCSNLTSIPSELFQGVSGENLNSITPKQTGMFQGTFQNCTGLTGNIPTDLFSEIDGSVQNAMTDIFSGDGNLATTCAEGDVIDTNSDGTVYPWKDYTSQWTTTSGNLAVACDVPTAPEYKFFIKTTNEASGFDFSWNLAPKGTFYVDCGDPSSELVYPDNSTSTGGGTITKTTFDVQTYFCRYNNGGEKTVSFGGAATGYGQVVSENLSINSGELRTISFAGNQYVARAYGALGDIFPEISYKYPNFWRLFYNCVNLTEVSDTLFSGISRLATNAFKASFYGCSKLASIPEDLFLGVSSPNIGMFHGTFYGCTSLESIPANLFNHINGSDGFLFMETFKNCTGLSGQIPEGLFDGVSGNENAIFEGVFSGCSNLGRNEIGGVPTYYISPTLFRNFGGTIGSNAFSDTGFLECCPEEMRRITSADSEYNIARYVNYFSNRVSCINGTPAANEASWITLPGQSTPSCQVLDCGKELHVRNSETFQQYDYPLFRIAKTEKSLAVKMNQNETCYAPLTEATTAAYGLHIKKDGALYRVMTREDLQN